MGPRRIAPALPKPKHSFFYKGLQWSVVRLCERLYQAQNNEQVYGNLGEWEPKMPKIGHNIQEKGGRYHLALLAVTVHAKFRNGQWLFSTNRPDEVLAAPRFLKTGRGDHTYPYETAGAKQFRLGGLDAGSREPFVYQLAVQDPKTGEDHVFRLKQLDPENNLKEDSTSSVVFDVDHTHPGTDGSGKKTDFFSITFVLEDPSAPSSSHNPQSRLPQEVNAGHQVTTRTSGHSEQHVPANTPGRAGVSIRDLLN